MDMHERNDMFLVLLTVACVICTITLMAGQAWFYAVVFMHVMGAD